MDDNTDQLTKRLDETSSELEKEVESVDRPSDLQNVQVESEVTSLQLEKQTDRLTVEKEELIKDTENLRQDEQEVLTKVESYVQKNTEWVDKGKKLSAKQGSSTEHTEITEASIHQEKLELEAHQENVNTTSDGKSSNKHLEENSSVASDSINRLSTKKSEVVQKHDLLPIKTMEKVEHLSPENKQLKLEGKEITNLLTEPCKQSEDGKQQVYIPEDLKLESKTNEQKSKDLDTETEEIKDNKSDYHSMQELFTELVEYKSLIEIQEQEIKDLKGQLMQQDFINTNKQELEIKNNSLQLQYDKILAENANLIRKIREQSGVVHQEKQIEEELIPVHKRINKFEKLISSHNFVKELQSNIFARKNDVAHSSDQASHLDSVIVVGNKETRSIVENVSEMTIQLEEVKGSVTQTVERRREHQEILENSSTISSLEKKIKELNMKMLETENLLESKSDELNAMEKQKEERDITIFSLTEQLKLKDETFHQTVNDWIERYNALEEQLNADIVYKENEIQVLTAQKARETDRARIFAVNLRHKVYEFKELGQTFDDAKKKWAAERKEHEKLRHVGEKKEKLEKEINILNEKLHSSHQQVENQLVEAQKLKDELRDCKQQITSLVDTNEKLSEEISGYNIKFEDTANQFDEFERRFSALSTENKPKKSDEHDNFNIERNENEVATGVREERYLTELLETTETEAGAQLQDKTDDCKEVPPSENLLEKSFTDLIADFARAKRTALENEIIGLRKTIAILKSDKKETKCIDEPNLISLQDSNEGMDIDVELQNQLELFDDVRSQLAEINRKMIDQISKYANQHETLCMDITAYTQKFDEQQKTLMENTEKFAEIQHQFKQIILELNKLKRSKKYNENLLMQLSQEVPSYPIVEENLGQEILEQQDQEKQAEAKIEQDNQFN